MNKYLNYISVKTKGCLNYISVKIKRILKKNDVAFDLRQDALTEEDFNELDEAGFAMSRRFRLSTLRRASKLGTKDVGKVGQEVHGWMQTMFKNRYPWLHDNGVFDRAINYAFEYYNPEVFNVIKHYDFDNAIINVMNLPERTWYDQYPEFQFEKVVILTQGKTFEESVTWVANIDRFDNDGYSVKKTVTNCSFLYLGFTLWDRLVLVLKDAAGMGKLFFEAKYETKQMDDIQEQILKMHIYSKRQKEKVMNEKLLEKDIKYNQLKEEHQYFLDGVKAGDTRNPEKKLEDFAREYDEKYYKGMKINWKRAITIGITIILVLGIMFLIAGFT